MIIDTIKREIDQYENESIEIVPGFIFNQRETIERIYRLYNSKFKKGDKDSEGFKKYFYNIVRSTCDVSTKLIDFDVKDILFVPEPGHSELKVWLLEREFKYWAKKNSFGLILNRIFRELPIFGSVVLKKVDKTWKFVDLRNFYVDQSADSLDKAEYIIEKHIYTIGEFLKEAKRNKWQDVEKVLDSLKEPYITTWERYGYNDENQYTRTIIAFGERKDEITEETQVEGIILSQEQVDKHPYFEFHWEKIPGRWLGIGRVELLFDAQTRINELINLKVKSSYWSSLQIFQTQDDSFSRNLLTDVRNGEVLKTRTGISPINTTEKNLSSIFNEEQQWLNNRDEITSSYDILRGERMPSGVPLGVAQITATMGSSYFDQIRENIALRVKEWLYKYILPEFQKEVSKQHLFLLTGKDFERVRETLKEAKIWQKIQNFIKRNKAFPTVLQEQLIREAIETEYQNTKSETVEIPNNFYGDLEYSLEIVITGESMNTTAKAITYQTALQMINNNPQVFENPLTRALFFRMLELTGVNPGELPLPNQTSPTPLKQGGSLAKPVIPSNLTTLPQEQKI